MIEIWSNRYWGRAVASRHCLNPNPRTSKSSLKVPFQMELYSKPERTGHDSDQLCTLAKSKTIQLFQTVSDLIGISPNIEFGYYTQLTGPNGLPVLSIQVGDIIEVQCTNGKDVSSHYPVVHHVFNQRGLVLQNNNCFYILWGVSWLFRWRNSAGDIALWASVRLCELLFEAPLELDGMHGLRKFLMGSSKPSPRCTKTLDPPQCYLIAPLVTVVDPKNSST